MDLVVSPFLTVRIDGAPIRLAYVDDATDGIAPEAGSAQIRIPCGRTVLEDGTVITQDPVIGTRMPVQIQSTDNTYVWNGEVGMVERMGSGTGRWLNLTCQGDGAAFERCVLSTFRAVSYLTGALPFTMFRFVDLNNNENADCSPLTYDVGGQNVHCYDEYDNNRTLWNQAQAISTVLQVGQVDAGLPASLLSDPQGLMTKQLSWRIGGRSVFATIGTIVGSRSDAVWTISRDAASNRVINIMPARGGGLPLDLTGPTINPYSVRIDGRSTLKGCRYMGSRQNFILTLQLYPASTGGDLIADWTPADVTAYQNGDLNSPAYRKFKINPSVSLPDASSAGNARMIGGIPMIVTDLTLPTLLGGPGYSSQAIVLWQSLADSSWVSASGKISITRRDDACGVWIDGARWIDIYQQAYRIAFTVGMESIQAAAVSEMDGDGIQWGFVNASSGQVCVCDAGTYVGIGSNGAAVLTPDVTFRNDLPTMQAVLDAYWEWYQHDLVSVSYTQHGVVSNGWAPGQVVSEVTLWNGDGTTTETLPVNSCWTRRSIRWTEKGASITLTSQRLPPDLNAIAGGA